MDSSTRAKAGAARRAAELATAVEAGRRRRAEAESRQTSSVEKLAAERALSRASSAGTGGSSSLLRRPSLKPAAADASNSLTAAPAHPCRPAHHSGHGTAAEIGAAAADARTAASSSTLAVNWRPVAPGPASRRPTSNDSDDENMPELVTPYPTRRAAAAAAPARQPAALAATAALMRMEMSRWADEVSANAELDEAMFCRMEMSREAERQEREDMEMALALSRSMARSEDAPTERHRQEPGRPGPVGDAGLMELFELEQALAMGLDPAWLLEGRGGDGARGDVPTEEPMTYEQLVELEDVRVTATPQQVAMLPTKRESGTNKGACSICQVGYETGDLLMTLRCSHAFHADCAREWLLNYATLCPNCKERAIR